MSNFLELSEPLEIDQASVGQLDAEEVQLLELGQALEARLSPASVTTQSSQYPTLGVE